MNVIVSKHVNRELAVYLRSTFGEVELFEEVPSLAPAVSCHPDMLYCKLKPGIVYKGDEKQLASKYPADISYNACSTGKYFIHNLEFTDPGLLALAKQFGLIPINVRQGYTKCNIVVVDSNSIITSDEGIAISCKAAGLDVLLISQGGILLPGYNTGFIGGCSGNSGKEIVFNGNLSDHPDFEKVNDYICSRGLKVKYFESYPLTDIGSVIFCD